MNLPIRPEDLGKLVKIEFEENKYVGEREMVQGSLMTVSYHVQNVPRPGGVPDIETTVSLKVGRDTREILLGREVQHAIFVNGDLRTSPRRPER